LIVEGQESKQNLQKDINAINRQEMMVAGSRVVAELVFEV
jgi:hypothetical protein